MTPDASLQSAVDRYAELIEEAMEAERSRPCDSSPLPTPQQLVACANEWSL